MVTKESGNTEARGARNVIVEKHAEHHVDRQDTESGSAIQQTEEERSLVYS